MSMPIINIPLERIESHIGKAEGHAYADDRHLSPDAEDAIQKVIRKGKLCDAPFYEDDAWQFLRVGPDQTHNIANGLHPKIAEALASDEAAKDAREMAALQWARLLRNAMAHGGIAYLDENGQSSFGSPVKMFAFVSGKYGKPKCQHAEGECRFGVGALEGLRILRISEDAYIKFLFRWVAWLADNKIAQKTAA